MDQQDPSGAVGGANGALPPASGSAAAPLDLSRVTVVVTTYNRKDMLRRTLEALLANETGDVSVDVRIVDDGSVDGTEAVVREIIAAYRGPMRLHYLRQENQGHSAAVNRGFRDADTDIVLGLDDDTVPQPGWLLALVRAPWGPTTAAVGGKIVGVEAGNQFSRYCRYIKYNEFPPNDEPIKFVNSGNSAYLRRAFLEMNGMESLICLGGEDIELAWRLVKAGYTLEYQPDAVVLHFHRETMKALLKTFWTRGYSKALRNVIWGAMPKPRLNRVPREIIRLVGAYLPLLWVPLDARKLRREGVPREDALTFAFLDQLNRAYSRHGRVTCFFRIWTGRQSIERTGVVPPGDGDASMAPGWALQAMKSQGKAAPVPPHRPAEG